MGWVSDPKAESGLEANQRCLEIAVANVGLAEMVANALARPVVRGRGLAGTVVNALAKSVARGRWQGRALTMEVQPGTFARRPHLRWLETLRAPSQWAATRSSLRCPATAAWVQEGPVHLRCQEPTRAPEEREGLGCELAQDCLGSGAASAKSRRSPRTEAPHA